MKRLDIIKLAREAGITGMLTDVVCEWKNIERFAELVAAHVITQRPPAIVLNTSDIDQALLRDMLAKASPMPIVPEAVVIDVAAAVADEREACAKVCDAKAKKWHKEAQRHLPRYRSDHAERDLSKAKICEDNAATIRSRNTAY